MGIVLLTVEPGRRNRLVADNSLRPVARCRVDPSQVGIRFGAGDKECAGFVKAEESLEIQIGAIHHIDCRRLRNHQIKPIEVVQFAVGNMYNCRDISPQVQQRVHLGRCLGAPKRRPWKQRQAEVDGGRVQGIYRVRQIQSQVFFGSALSGLPYQVRRDIVPGMRGIAEGFFVPLFFAAAGLHLSISFIELPVLTIAALVIVPFVGKFAGALTGAFVTRQEMPFTLATGMMAKGVAEIALLLVLLETGVIGQSIFSLLVLIMVAHILLVPPVINSAISRVKSLEHADQSAGQMPSLAHLDFALDDITVDDILDRSRTYPDSSLSVRAFVDRWVVPHQRDYVIVEQGRLLGTVALDMLLYLPKNSWASTPVGKFMRQDSPCVWLSEPVEDALQKMTENSLSVMPVLDEKSREFLGIITSQEILDLMILEARGEH